MSVDVIAHATTLSSPTGANIRTFGSSQPVLAGDTLIVLIGGGSHVTDYPNEVGWVELDNQSGQEAQGFVMAREFTADAEAGTWDVQFDGGDKSLISVIHLRGSVAYVLDGEPLRAGNVGVTRPPETLSIPAVGVGDVEFLFAFARNAGDNIPTADGTALASLDNGSETGALYRDNAPADPRTVDVPSCTGRYVVALNVRDVGTDDTRLPARQVKFDPPAVTTVQNVQAALAELYGFTRVVVIDADEDYPPDGTPDRTVVFQRIT